MRTILLLSCCLFFTASLFSQSDFDTKKKFYFFKTWNWLKYYHPGMATGKVPADSFFLRYWPLASEAKDNKAFNKVLQHMTGALPKLSAKVASNSVPAQPAIMRQNLDTAWCTDDPFLSPAIKKQLLQAFIHRYTDTGHYYLPEKNYTTDIPHEPGYPFADSLNIPYEYRMLALAKIQGAIDYLFPHKYLMDSKWNTTLLHFITLFTRCDSRLQYEKLLLNITATFNDTHAWNFNEDMKNRRRIFRNNFYPPFEYQLFDSKILVTGIIIEELCNKAGIQKGDLITSLDGISVTERIRQLSQLLSASNINVLWYRLGKYTDNFLFAADKPSVSIQVDREGKTSSSELLLIQGKDTGYVRRLGKYFNTKPSLKKQNDQLTYLDSGVVYFNINNTFRFIEHVPDQRLDTVMDSLLTIMAHSKALVFDMRDYPDWPGFAFTYLYKKFGKKANIYGWYYEVNKQYVGTYTPLGHHNDYFPPGITTENFDYNGKVIIIVNPVTRSMSEWHTMNLQKLFPNSITIGQQTAGADGDMKKLTIPGNYAMPFTGNAIFYPDGAQAQRIGVRIDRPYYPSSEEILTGEDILLNKALQIINER